MSDNTEQYYIPRMLDEKARYLFWTVDEFIAFIIPVYAGLVNGAPGQGIVAAYFVNKFYKKFKASEGAKYLWLAVYWYAGNFAGFKGMPESHIRRWHG